MLADVPGKEARNPAAAFQGSMGKTSLKFFLAPFGATRKTAWVAGQGAHDEAYRDRVEAQEPLRIVMWVELLAYDLILRRWLANPRASRREIGVFSAWKSNLPKNDRPQAMRPYKE
jgi:hypothetical protein